MLNFQNLAEKAGIIYAAGAQPKTLDSSVLRQIAMDSALITAPNSGIPALFTQWVDPKVIEVLVEPMKMAEAFSEVKKGDWTTTAAIFPMIESTGQVSTYGDFNENGVAGVNVNFPSRQPYTYQTIIRVGEKEMAIMGNAKIDMSSRKQIAAALTLNKFQNKTYIYGVKGLENYGMLNDPSLLPSIVDTPWASKEAQAIFESFQKLYAQLVKQTNGLIDRNTAMKCILSPTSEVNLTKTNMYNVNVADQLKKNFPNLSFSTVPEYETAAGEVVQLIVEDYEGQPTVDLGFTEKMRVHPLIQLKSGFEQKRSQGSFGAIIYRPLFVASMLVS